MHPKFIHSFFHAVLADLLNCVDFVDVGEDRVSLPMLVTSSREQPGNLYAILLQWHLH